jgi:hypothetical protein
VDQFDWKRKFYSYKENLICNGYDDPRRFSHPFTLAEAFPSKKKWKLLKLKKSNSLKYIHTKNTHNNAYIISVSNTHLNLKHL